MEKAALVEHTFEVRIEGVQGLTPLQSTVWGEADCYIQYRFPAQDSASDTLREGELSQKGELVGKVPFGRAPAVPFAPCEPRQGSARDPPSNT